MRYSISDTAEYGDVTRGPRVITDARRRRRCAQILGEIQDGTFAREWVAEDDAGRPNFAKLVEGGQAPPDRGGRREAAPADELGRHEGDLIGPIAAFGARGAQAPSRATAIMARAGGLRTARRSCRGADLRSSGNARRSGSLREHRRPPPVVLIAEELSPSAVALLGEDFEVRHVDGADRPRCCRRSPRPTRCIVRAPPRSTPRRSPPRRGSRSWPGPASASTTSTSRRRPRAASWSSTRRSPTSSAPPSTPSRCCSPSPAGSRRPTPACARGSGSAAVHRRRAHRQDRRRARPRQDRRAGRAAAVGVRHPAHRLRPVRLRRPAPRSWASRCVSLDELLAEPT